MARTTRPDASFVCARQEPEVASLPERSRPNWGARKLNATFTWRVRIKRSQLEKDSSSEICRVGRFGAPKSVVEGE